MDFCVYRVERILKPSSLTSGQLSAACDNSATSQAGTGLRINWTSPVVPRLMRGGLVERMRVGRHKRAFAHPTHLRTLRRRLALIGAAQAFDVELDHFEHRLHRAPGAGAVGPAEIFWQRCRHDLP